MGIADVARNAVVEDVGVAEDTAVREVCAARPDSDLSIFSVPEKLVLSSRHDIVPQWDYCEGIYPYMRHREENCYVQAKDLPAWFIEDRAYLIECLTEIQIRINFVSPKADHIILQEILFKTVSTIER